MHAEPRLGFTMNSITTGKLAHFLNFYSVPSPLCF